MQNFLSTCNPIVSQGAAFDPTTLTGYELHFIGDTLGDEGYTGGGTIDSGWLDETSTYDLTNYSGTPTYETSVVNGHDVARFTGSTSDRLRDTDTLIDNANKWTQVWVMNTPSTATQLFLHRSSTAENYFLKRTDDDLSFFATNGTCNLGTGDFVPGVAVGNWWIIIWTVDFSTGSASVYINDVTADATASDTANANLPTDSYWHIPTDTGYPDMDLAEVILYNDYVLTSQEISDMFTYMGTKYNISVTT